MTRNACRSIISVIAVLMALTSGAFAQVVINEVHYRPAAAAVAQGEDPARLEFVELYNSGAAAVDLSGWSIKSAVEFTFPGGTLLAPDAYVVVARDPAFLKARYPSMPQGVQLLAWKSGDLSAGVVQLLDASQPLSMTVDQVAYSDNGLWPSEPSGTGPSLELLSARLDNANPRAWRASIGVNGTPGMRNSRASDGPIVIDETPQRGTSAVGLTQVSVTFSDAVRGVVASDLIVDGMPATSVSGTGAGPYVFTVDPPKSEHIPVTLNNGAIASFAGPSFSGDSWYYFDPPPTVMSMPAGAGGGPGSYANVPIYAAPGNPGGIYGIDMTITYDPLILEILATTDVTVSGAAAGLTPPFGIAVNISTPGTVVISEYAQGPALTSPGGEIANIRFHVKAGAVYGTTSNLTFASVSIDERTVPAQTHDGLFTVNCVGAGNGSACDDGTVCNGHETCVDNACTPGTALDCDDHNVCTTDTCDPVSGCQHGNEPTTVVCRASAGECDVAENCDGAGACPADAFEPAGTACGSNSDTVCDNPDTCSGTANTCLPNHEPTTVVCRASAGECDVAENCDGAGACPADAFEPAGTACGSNSDTVCDNPDTCSGTANTCLPNHEPTTVVCRASAGECDVAENCDGAGACPADAFEPAGTACGSNSDTVCDNPDTCSGTANTCLPNHEPTTVVCRASAGECDVAENCDGAGACPADAFEPAGTACGSNSDTVCDNPDTCSGTANTCLPNHEPTTVVCRASAGECDVAENCDGAGACPADAFEPAGTACGSNSDTVCDNPDTCSGTANTCLPNHEPTTVVCRASAGQCDVAENCDGAGACPADAFEPAGTACGSNSDTVCDNPDTCSGTANTCLPNHEPTTVVCRASAGQCDVAENCDGAGACPADAFEPAGTACGSNSDTVCDNPDTCSGTANTCLPNHEPTTVVCRASAGECDVAENCDGAGACPADAFEPAGTACGSSSSDQCDAADTCNGEGACQLNHVADGTFCGDAGTECTNQDTCLAGACADHGFQPSGTACGSSSSGQCDAADTCNGAGACQLNHVADGTFCGDAGTECTNQDTCLAGACADHGFQPSGTACGSSSSGQCDAADTCNGAGACQLNHVADGTNCGDAGTECTNQDTCLGGTCADHGFKTPGTACGSSSSGPCDAADTCDGAGTCQANHASPSVVCRSAAGECDVDDFCDGSGACTADAKKSVGTACSDDGNVCTTDLCNGASNACVHSPGNAGTVCGASLGDCDLPETCTGSSSACPAKTFDCSVGAHVFYYRDDTANGGLGGEPSTKPVAGVPINLTGFATASTTSDPAGAYGFGNLFGNVTVTAANLSGGARATTLSNVIGSLDASRIAQSVVLLYTLSAKQFTAGDVTGDHTISAFDASYVARYAAQLVDHFPVGGGVTDWTFVPLTYGYTPITANGGLDFLAILYGDVTGNWPREDLMLSQATGSEAPKTAERNAADAELANLLANRPAIQAARNQNAGPAVLSTNERPGVLRVGERRQITINLQDADGILGLDMSLGYDASRIKIVDVQATGVGTSFIWAKGGKNGTYKLAGYGIDPLSGSGPLLTVTVEALQNGGGSNLLRIQASANEGAIPIQARGNGKEAQLSR